MASSDLAKLIDSFEWDSEDQRKGYLGLIQYLRHKGLDPKELDVSAAFFIQKDHESHEWMVEMLGRIIDSLQREIKHLKDRLDAIECGGAQ